MSSSRNGDKMGLRNDLKKMRLGRKIGKKSFEKIEKTKERDEQEIKKMIDILENVVNISPDTNNGDEIVELCKEALEVIGKIELKLSALKNKSNDIYPLEKAKKILREIYEQGKNEGVKLENRIGDEKGFERGYKKGLNDMKKLKEL